MAYQSPQPAWQQESRPHTGPPIGPPAGPPIGPGPGVGRPRQVTVAAVLLLLLPLVGVAGLVVALAAMSVAQDNAADVVAELEAEFVGPEFSEFPEFAEFFDAESMVDSMLSAMWFQVALTSVVRLVQAVGFGILAFAVLRGSQAGRIITFVLAGVLSGGALCLGVLGGVRQSLRSELDRMGEDLGITYVYEDDLLPGWYHPLNWVVIVASIVLILAVVWLLTRPAANEYFRRPRPSPPPGMPPPGMPYPGPFPGPPPAGQHPGPPYVGPPSPETSRPGPPPAPPAQTAAPPPPMPRPPAPGQFEPPRPPGG